MAANHGLTDLTVASVALAAGVTKGGLFHHFANKQALIDAMFEDLMEQLDERVDALMAADAMEHGRFTRAYVLAATSVSEQDRRIWGALASAMTAGYELCRRWYVWLDERLGTHSTTDSGLELEVVRLAADGAWLMTITRAGSVDLDRLRERLVVMTEAADVH